MDSKVKARWVAALRSGDYKQGRLRLRTTSKLAGDKFCCLGVLCDIEQPELWGKGKEWHNDGSTAQLPYPLRLKLGIECGDQGRLVELNDSGSNFEAIADWIEENL